MLPMPLRILKLFPAVLVAAAFLPRHAAAERVSVEGVAGVVNDDPILFSDVEEFRQAMDEQQPSFAALPVAEQREQALQRLIDEKVILAKAQQDTSLRVTDQEVSSHVQDVYNHDAEQQGGEKQLELALRQTTGMTLGQFKARLQEQVRDQLYRQKLQMKYIGDPDPSQLQVQQFFHDYHDSLPIQKDGVRLSHIQWRIKADPKIDAASKAKADSLIKQLDAGASFANLAKIYSDDPSAKDGGDLGYTKRGTLDPDYERGAWALDVGDYSTHPVRSRFGYHIILVTGKKDNEIRTSHILIRVIPSTQDTARALAFMDSVRQTLKTGPEFAAAAREISEDRDTRDQGGDLGWFSRDQLDPAYKAAVDSLDSGQVTQPILIGDSYNLFRVDRKAAARHLSLEEDYAQISAMAKQWIISQKLASLVKDWRQHVHIENRLAEFHAGGAADDASAGGDTTSAPE